jgi:hypothetical protein
MAGAGFALYSEGMDTKPPVRDPHLGKPFAEMSSVQKLSFVAKVCACVLTLGIAFPNVMSD